MAKGLSYLALGVVAGAALVAASEGALQAAAFGGDRLTLFNDVFNKVRDNYGASDSRRRRPNPHVRIARFQTTLGSFSDNPVFRAGLERIVDGLRKAGLREQ